MKTFLMTRQINRLMDLQVQSLQLSEEAFEGMTPLILEAATLVRDTSDHKALKKLNQQLRVYLQTHGV